MRHLRFLLLAAVTWVVATGLVNPALQPKDFFDRYRVVATLRVIAVDSDAKVIRLAVTEVCKGTLAAKEVQVSLSGPAAEKAADEVLVNGSTVVAFIGKTRAGGESEVLFYPGSGRWQSGRLEHADDPARWIWDKDLALSLFGTFNGASDRLAEMMADARDGRCFFPATSFAGFKAPITVEKLSGPARGVALYDLDGDDRLDVVACSAQGDRVWMQTAPLKFSDRTIDLGISSSASPSVAIGDLNGDGIPDLLLGTQAWLGTGSGKDRRFIKTDLLLGIPAAELKCAALAEINGDGWPDVVLSRRGKGLAVLLNPGVKGGQFSDATSALGLDSPDCGQDGDGFFAPGDWNGDGRTDIFYAVRNGLILTQDANGRFTPIAHDLDPGLEDTDGLGGTAAFAPLWTRDGRDLLFSTGLGVHLVINQKSRVRERTAAGNELNETSIKQLALIAEDLDADGNVDVFVASHGQFPCKFFANRGYGSFTCPLKYRRGVIPDAVQEFGAWGLAAGDVDGDGANDLLLGGVDGRIVLLLNDTLSDRPLLANEDAPLVLQALARTRILSVTVAGRGTVGADATLTDAKGRVITRHQVGGNVATGCRGPDTLNLAVREPGPHTLTVRYADGVSKTWSVDLAVSERRVVLRAARE